MRCKSGSFCAFLCPLIDVLLAVAAIVLVVLANWFLLGQSAYICAVGVARFKVAVALSVHTHTHPHREAHI